MDSHSLQVFWPRLALCLGGIALSLYALDTQRNLELDSTFSPACDLHASVSCSTVFRSKYGRGFGIAGALLGDDHWLNVPNVLVGLLFFVCSLLVGLLSSKHWVFAYGIFAATSLACLSCVYLAYILAFLLHDLCVVCLTSYVLNGALLCISWREVKLLNATNATKATKANTSDWQRQKKDE